MNEGELNTNNQYPLFGIIRNPNIMQNHEAGMWAYFFKNEIDKERGKMLIYSCGDYRLIFDNNMRLWEIKQQK